MKPEQLEAIRKVVRYEPTSGLFLSVAEPVAPVVGVQRSGELFLEIEGRSYRACRLAWLLMTGELPPREMRVVYANGIRRDNRWMNLELKRRT